MQPLTAILVLALAALASAKHGIKLECPGTEWAIFRDQFETSCLKLMPEPKLFPDAIKTCHGLQSRLISLLHKRHKIGFVSDLIIKSGAENSTLWFADHFDAHRGLLEKPLPAFAGTPPPLPPTPPPVPEVQPRWFAISPHAVKSKVEVVANDSAVPRRFICEAPARPAAQRAQLEREPEDAFIADELLHEPAAAAKDNEKKQPFVLTFNCQAFGIPKPTVSWVITTDAGADKHLTTEAINATIIHEPRLPIDEKETGVRFFNLQRDCKAEHCPNDNIQERSQLIVVNAHKLDLKKRIACIASNDFGSVISREAQIFVNKLGEFHNTTAQVITLKTGIPAFVLNNITADPDSAAVECFRIMATANGPAALLPSEDVNRATRGAIQMSKAAASLIIDAATPEDAGRYVCQARMHNGRLGHVIREHAFALDVKPCPPAEPECKMEAKKVAVVAGFPAVLSMNHLSNRIIRTGDDFLLECPCIGKRHPAEELAVEWNLNNRTDIAAMAFPLLPINSALLIRDAEPEKHEGEYHCRCMRGAEASDWSSVKIHILPAPVPTQFVETINAKVGQNAVIKCEVPHLGAEVTTTVQPLRGAKALADAVPAAEAARFKVAKTGANQFTLTIDKVKEIDADVYGCRVIANYLGKWVEFNMHYTTLLVDKARR